MLATQVFLEGTAGAVSTATQIAHGVPDACAHLHVIGESIDIQKNKHAYFTLNSIILLVFYLKSRDPGLYCLCIYRQVQLPKIETGNCPSFLEKTSLKMLGFPLAWVTGPTLPGDWQRTKPQSKYINNGDYQKKRWSIPLQEQRRYINNMATEAHGQERKGATKIRKLADQSASACVSSLCPLLVCKVCRPCPLNTWAKASAECFWAWDFSESSLWKLFPHTSHLKSNWPSQALRCR